MFHLFWSGVTSLDVKEQGKLKVTGEFDNFEMTKKLKKICKHIDIIAVGTEPIQNRNPVTRREPSMPITRPPPPIPHRRPQRVQGQNSDPCIIM